MEITKIISNEYHTGKYTSIIISSRHEFESENYLIIIKAPEYISKFFPGNQ